VTGKQGHWGDVRERQEAMRATELLERDGELVELSRAAASACAGRGGMVVIEAHAGLGKTSLLRASRDGGAANGLTVLTARATELEADFPFALVRQLFEPRLADMPIAERDDLFDGASAARTALGQDGGDGAVADAFSVLHGLYWMTAALADRMPLLLAIDDMHWSDPASLDYLGFLLPRLDELAVLVVATCRPDERGAPTRLRQIAADAQVQRLTPRALSSEASTALLAAELSQDPDPEFASACQEVTGGNPFLLCELVETIATEGIVPHVTETQTVRELMPERIAQTVLLRVARLSPSARAAARSLSVLGDDSDHRLVAALAELDVTALRVAADALRGIAILDPGDALRFAHPLVRAAVYADIPASERAMAHARAAAILRADGANPEQMAAQLVVSEPQGDPETVAVLMDAGARALSSGASRSAIAYLTRALREPPPPELRPTLLEALLTATIRAADYPAFAAIEADVFAEMGRTPALQSRWASELTIWMALTGRIDKAVELLGDGIEVAAREGDVDRAFRLEAQLAILAQQPAEKVRARLDRYRGQIDPDSPSGRLEAALDSYRCALDGNATEAAELARRALRDGLIFHEQPELTAPAGAVNVLLLANDLEGARRGAEQALRVAQERDAMPELVAAWALRATVSWCFGDLHAAEADVRQGVAIARLAGLHIAVPVLLPTLIDVLIERGELAAAEAELETVGMATIDLPDLSWLHALLFERGRLRLEQGRLREAVDDLLELERRRVRLGVSSAPMLLTGPYTADALRGLGEAERARELAERDLLHARRWGAPSGISRALRSLGLTVGGAEGLDLLHEAVAVLGDVPARLAHAHALADLGAALRRANRRADAREPLREALALARGCGAAGLARRVNDELQATGERVRRHTPIGVESLTPSERRVAEMAETGMTNREIAQTLFLTVKTIETHLSAAYDKLGIRSRRELSGALSNGR